MFISAKLVFESYIPEQLEKGMWFKQRMKDIIYGKIYQYDRIYELRHVPSHIEEYCAANGYPVKPVIMSITANPDEPAVLLAKAEQIGWWDVDPFDDDENAELRDIELNDINMILSDYDNEVDIHVNDAMFEQGIVQPIIYMDKVTLTLPMDKAFLLDEEEEDEDMDDMDDLTDNDPQDYETE